MSEPTRLRWRAAPPSEIRWAAWDSSFVLFHRPSGKTHFLNEASALLLQQVLVQPLDVHATAARLAPLCGAPADQAAAPAYLKHVFGLLVRLEELGLVRRIVEAAGILSAADRPRSAASAPGAVPHA